MPHFQEGPPLQQAVATTSGVDLLADLAGKAPPAKEYSLNTRPSFLDATALCEGSAQRQLPTSPLTLPTSTFGMPSPALVEKGPRWMQPDESIPGSGPHSDKVQLNCSWVASVPLSPQLPLPPLRTSFTNSGGDVGVLFQSPRSEEKEVDGADLSSPVAGAKMGYGPEYVQQRRQFWSTVLGDIASSSQAKDKSVDYDSDTLAAEPRHWNVAPSSISPPAVRERAKSVEEYAARDRALARTGSLRQSSLQEHDRVVAYRGTDKQPFEGAEDQCTSWKKEDSEFATTWQPSDDVAKEARGGGFSGSGSGSGGGSGFGCSTPVGASPRAHSCSLCQHRFKRVCDLKKHKAAVHAKLRPFACKQCGKTFGQAGTRSKHYRTVHVGLKPHRCGVCERTFSEKGNMRKHMLRVHQFSAPLP